MAGQKPATFVGQVADIPYALAGSFGVTTVISLPGGLASGVCTVAFNLTDAGGLNSSCSYPNSQPVPGGPLTFTVTP